MKRTLTLFVLVFTFISGIALCQAPTYSLMVRNMMLNSPTDNELQFDIYLMRTGANTFEYARGRYEFTFNPLIANGGTLTYDTVANVTDMPDNQRVRNPQIVGDELHVNYNIPPGAGNGEIISDVFPGTLVARMILTTTAPVFATEYLRLDWKNPGDPSGPPRTRVFAYVGGVMDQITDAANHTIDSSGIGSPMPVELASFSATVVQNSVSLNWRTTSEINNSGFSVERKSTSENWKQITFVNGNGNSSSMNQYSYTDANLNAGTYNYRLKQVDFNGNYEYFELTTDVNIGTPSKFDLAQNYPNPFNPATTIAYDIPHDGMVTMKLFDISGKLIRTMINEYKSPGFYSLSLNASSLSSGVYFYTLSMQSDKGSFSSTKRMMILK